MKRLSPAAMLLAAAVACGGPASGPASPSAAPSPPSPVPGPAPDQEATLVGAGDIAVCGSRFTEATARLLDAIPGTVFTAGDHAYPSGTAQQFRDCYDPTWGRHKARTRPSPGNHDYDQPGAGPYFAYFGANAGAPGMSYYSFDLGAWHVVSLDSNVPAHAGSSQTAWLRQDLTSNPTSCTAAYWHHPRFSSGPNGDSSHMRDLWRVLYEFGVEVVIAGHDHLYERFAPQDPDGRFDPTQGIRQFTVGTGGAPLYAFTRVRQNSEVRGNAFGVLKLTLRAGSYGWEFVPAAGEMFIDSGSAPCH